MSTETDSFRPLASVFYLGIPGFTHKTVPEQVKLRAQLDAAVAAAASPLAEADRLVLDAPDGAAIVVLGNPRAALQAAERAIAIAATESATLCAGINHGPVKLANDQRKDSLLVGDGIDAAVAIAGFARPGQLLVSRSFRDALAETAPSLAMKFHRAGNFTDKNIRAHELFSLNAVAPGKVSRRLFFIAAVASVGIVALGGAARLALQSLATSRQPATLVFDIRPQGEIDIDGVMKGKAPAITRLQVSPGVHLIEVRNGRYPPFVTEVNLSPGEQMDVKYSFIAPTKPKRAGFMERFKFWK